MDITQRQITKIAREVGRFTARVMRVEGVGASELDFLHAVRKSPGCTQTDVCNRLGIDKGAAARQSARLEQKGYLTRRANPADGRSHLLYATSASETLKNSKTHVENRFYEWLMQSLDATERTEFVRMLNCLYQCCKTESRADFPHVRKLITQEAADDEK